MAILEVSNRTVKFRRKVLNLRTVTAFEKIHGRSRQPYSGPSIFLVAFVGLLSLRFVTMASTRLPAFVILLGCVFYVVYALASNREPRDFWLLRIETAAGSTNLLASRDEQAISRAVAALTEAMESDANVQHVVNIADSTLIADSVIEGSTVTHVGRTA